MCFDGSGDHAPPAARHLFPDSAGRSVRLFRFSSRLGQRGIAPLGARPLDEPRRQVEIDERHVPHAVGVQQRRRVLPEHRPEGARGRREAERAAGLGVHVRHGQRQVGRGEPVEPEPGALGQQLPYLDVVSLAGALLVAAPRIAVEQPRLARPLAEQRRDRPLVGELSAVVGEHGAEHAGCSLLGRCSSVSRQAESSRAPSTVSISQAAAHASSPRARNAACDLLLALL